MKYLKTRIWQSVFALALFMVGVVGFAQPPQGKVDHEQRAQKMTEKMVSGLQLDEKQAAAVKEINQRYAKQHAELWQNSNVDRADKPARMQALGQQKENELQSVLTKEQFGKFLQMKEEHQGQMKGKMQGRDQQPPNPEERAKHQTERMQKQLNLTQEQAEKAAQINLKYAKQAEAQHQERQEQQNKQKKVREQQEQELKNILTEEQKKLFDQQKQEMKGKHHKGGKGQKQKMW